MAPPLLPVLPYMLGIPSADLSSVPLENHSDTDSQVPGTPEMGPRLWGCHANDQSGWEPPESCHPLSWFSLEYNLIVAYTRPQPVTFRPLTLRIWTLSSTHLGSGPSRPLHQFLPVCALHVSPCFHTGACPCPLTLLASHCSRLSDNTEVSFLCTGTRLSPIPRDHCHMPMLGICTPLRSLGSLASSYEFSALSNFHCFFLYPPSQRPTLWEERDNVFFS